MLWLCRVRYSRAFLATLYGSGSWPRLITYEWPTEYVCKWRARLFDLFAMMVGIRDYRRSTCAYLTALLGEFRNRKRLPYWGIDTQSLTTRTRASSLERRDNYTMNITTIRVIFNRSLEFRSPNPQDGLRNPRILSKDEVIHNIPQVWFCEQLVLCIVSNETCTDGLPASTVRTLVSENEHEHIQSCGMSAVLVRARSVYIRVPDF